jgi:hypothetical protein
MRGAYPERRPGDPPEKKKPVERKEPVDPLPPLLEHLDAIAALNPDVLTPEALQRARTALEQMGPDELATMDEERLVVQVLMGLL